MKVTVSKYLNVRVGKPSVNAPCYQYLAPGSIIEVEDQLCKGDVYDHIDTWYRDAANNYYWSGGFIAPPKTTEETPLFAATESNLDWYHKEYGITRIWDEFGIQGEGVTVAVIDSGIDKGHPYFKSARIEGADYVDSGNDYFSDKYGHGTRVASIIVANGPVLIGVAPKCTLFAAKCFNAGNPTPDSIADALEGLPAEIKIVIIAQSFLAKDFVSKKRSDNELKDVFRNCGRILLCTPGNNQNHDQAFNPIDKFPASIDNAPNIISVAAVGAGKKIFKASAKSNFITIAAPGENVKVISPYNTNNPLIESGTSYAAPFVGGVLALMYALMNKRNKILPIENVIEVLETSVLAPDIPDIKLFGKGIIDPLNTLRNLNQKL